MNIHSINALVAIMLCATITSARPDDPKDVPGTSPVYIRIGAGYGFVHAGRMEMNGRNINGSESSTGTAYSLGLKPASFGSGACADLAGGYMITRHIGLELGVHAIVAPTKYTFSGLVPGFGNTRTYISNTYAELPVYIIPALVLTTGKTLQLYTRVGIVLPVSDKLHNDETRSGNALIGQTEEVFTTDLKQRFCMGLQGAAGLAYVLNRHLSIWGEATGISRDAYTKRGTLTGYTEDGVDKLGTYTTSQKVTFYEFNYNVTYPAQASEPEKQPTFSVPFSSIGMSFGIKYAF
jgi:hypothetical protein